MGSEVDESSVRSVTEKVADVVGLVGVDLAELLDLVLEVNLGFDQAFGHHALCLLGDGSVELIVR